MGQFAQLFFLFFCHISGPVVGTKWTLTHYFTVSSMFLVCVHSQGQGDSKKYNFSGSDHSPDRNSPSFLMNESPYRQVYATTLYFLYKLCEVVLAPSRDAIVLMCVYTQICVAMYVFDLSSSSGFSSIIFKNCCNKVYRDFFFLR